MKKLILLALVMVGCEKEKPRQEDITPEVTTSVIYSYRKIIIDSCEYIGVGAHGVSHKGNCRFCKERRQKELEELVVRIKGK